MENPIVATYYNLLSGQIRGLPKGTWQDDRKVVILVRYVLEIKLRLSKEQIPRINREIIHENKLWGALNRFKSIRRLIHFVYPGQYREWDFYRVPVNYWSDKNRVKEFLEWKLEQEGIALSELPTIVNSELLLTWGFANPLKRYGDSPYKLLSELYPNTFKATDFKKVPHHYHKDITVLKNQFLHMLQQENIPLKDAPKKVNREMLIRYRFGGVLSSYSNNIAKFVTFLFPDYYSLEDFKMLPNGYWDDIENIKKVISRLIIDAGKTESDIPMFLTKKKLQQARLGGLLDKYNGSPIEIINAVYPGKFAITEFSRVPNKYWYKRENRIHALRNYCKTNQIQRDEIPLLNRSYFRKNFPRFISMVDRHYDSKFYKWIMESFPEHDFHPEEFKLLVGDDGQICDSQEELVIHNYLLQRVLNATIIREQERFFNKQLSEIYIPDWIIEQNRNKYIVEYFGLYNSNLFKGYNEKTERKIQYFNTLPEYKFIAIFPEDFKEEGFGKLERLLNDKGLATSIVTLS
ncbi:hypothetical protein [Bacillus niameyensis]|uniref:hypothetical protein n=1 Tax=Bacillus niameyensis TaxID=1522308 RepID=UPI001E33BFF8|nr:hypothetical protein [Bacillus niameyensis]